MMESETLILHLVVKDGTAKLEVFYNNTELTKSDATEIKDSVLETVYEKLDKFQNLKK